jgi:hypothetical protein
MAFCKFYKNSICTLKEGYCDLNCNQTIGDKDIQYYDEIDILTRWRMEEVQKEVESQGWELK